MRASLLANQASAFSSIKKGEAIAQIAQNDISRHTATNGDPRGRLRGAPERSGAAGRQKRRSLPGANSQLTRGETDRQCNELSSASPIFCLLSECSRSCDWPAGAPRFRRECGINSPQSGSTGPSHREAVAGGPAASVPGLYVPASV